jgi:hypothetical protein
VLQYVEQTAARYNALAGLARLVERVERRAGAVGYTF